MSATRDTKKIELIQVSKRNKIVWNLILKWIENAWRNIHINDWNVEICNTAEINDTSKNVPLPCTFLFRKKNEKNEWIVCVNLCLVQIEHFVLANVNRFDYAFQESDRNGRYRNPTLSSSTSVAAQFQLKIQRRLFENHNEVFQK